MKYVSQALQKKIAMSLLEKEPTLTNKELSDTARYELSKMGYRISGLRAHLMAAVRQELGIVARRGPYAKGKPPIAKQPEAALEAPPTPPMLRTLLAQVQELMSQEGISRIVVNRRSIIVKRVVREDWS